MPRRRQVLASLAGTGIVGLAGCSGSDSGDGSDGGSGGSSGDGSGGDGSDGTATPGETADGSGSMSETVKAAWVYIGLTDHVGWTQQHDKGRQHVAEKFDWVETSHVEEVPEEDSQRVFERFSQDHDLVIGTSFGYMDPMLNVSKQHPDVAYEHCSGVKQGDNMGLYYGRMAQARYLVGYAAGLVTETDTVGFVAAFPISAVLREMNGFAAGLKAANPDASIKVRWTNTWFDPPKAQEAAVSLVDQNCDVLGQVQDSPAVVRTARDNDIWATGSNAPMKQFGGDSYLTTGVWTWGAFYEDVVTAVRDGSWQADFSFPGYQDGIVDIDEFGPQVPDDVKSEVRDQEKKLENGNLDIWKNTKFSGMSPRDQYYEMSSFMNNFEGEVPE